MTPNPRGHYHFLPGIAPYSSGARADQGWEVVHATFRRPLPYRAGFERVEAHLAAAGRDRFALCGVELRSPAPFTRRGFLDFNEGYQERIRAWDLLVDGQNPLARTNVAPVIAAPEEPVLYGFSYTVPCPEPGPPTFVIAGGGELRGGPLLEAEVVRAGETSDEALAEKARYVMKAMSRRLAGLDLSWADVTAVDVYTARSFDAYIETEVLAQLGPTAIHGLRWFPSRPPIDELDYEMDVRGVRTELVL